MDDPKLQPFPEWYEAKPKTYDTLGLTPEQSELVPPMNEKGRLFKEYLQKLKTNTDRKPMQNLSYAQYQHDHENRRYLPQTREVSQKVNSNSVSSTPGLNPEEQEASLEKKPVSTMPRDLSKMSRGMARKVSRKMDTGSDVMELTQWLLTHMDTRLFTLFAMKQLALQSDEFLRACQLVLDRPQRYQNKHVLFFGNIYSDQKNNGHWILCCLTQDRNTFKVFDSYGDYSDVGLKNKKYEIPIDGLKRIFPNLKIEATSHDYQNRKTGTCGYWYCAMVYFKFNEQELIDSFQVPLDYNNSNIRLGNDIAVTYFYLQKYEKSKDTMIPDYLLRGPWEEKMDFERTKDPSPEPMEVDGKFKWNQKRKKNKTTLLPKRQAKPTQKIHQILKDIQQKISNS